MFYKKKLIFLPILQNFLIIKTFFKLILEKINSNFKKIIYFFIKGIKECNENEMYVH